MNLQLQKKHILNSIGLIIVAVAVFFVLTDQAAESEVTSSSIVAATTELSAQPVRKEFPNVSVSALAVHIYDVARGETLYARNADEQFPLASLTKVMTALVATETSPDPSEHVVQIDLDSLLTDGESGFWYGEQWNLDQLIDFMLISSSNDGAAAIARAMSNFVPQNSFVDAMNEKAEELGLTQTHFINPTGLDINYETEAGAFGSAHDMSILFAYVLQSYPDVIAVTQQQSATVSSLDRVHIIDNTNKIVHDIPWLLGTKTGYTDTAGGNLVVAFEAGLARPIVITVLGSTKEGRFEDMQKLINTTLEYFAQ